jgi:TolA-binding protein
VNNSKKIAYFLIMASLVLTVDSGFAQSRKKPTKTVAKKTATKRKAPPVQTIPHKGAEAKSSSTVADVLSRIKNNDRGGNVQLSKFTKIIPESNLPPKNVVVRDTKNIKPPSSMKFFIKGNEKEAQLERILDRQINELYSLSQKFRKSPERGEIWLRLGELYVEKSKLVQYRIQTDFDKKIADWEAKGRKGTPPKIDMDAPQIYNKKAIELYGWFIKDFPTSRKLDQAYFFMGFNFVELGQVKRGTAYYEKLTKDFPKSAYVTESYFATGEYYFENNDYKKAGENYKAVLKTPRSRIYPFAMYKLAWCSYRNGQPAVAISYLEKVIELSEENVNQESEDGKQVNKIRLADEAYNDLILFYPDVKSFESASTYFERMGGQKRVYSSLEKLGYLYSDRGNREAAKYIFQQLIEMNPDSPKNFDFQYQIVQNYSAGGSRQAFREELFNWITNYNSDSAWAHANPKDVQRSFEQRESTLRGYILNEHKALQKSRNPTGQKLTKNLYELYVKEFDKSTNAAEMRFFYGELLYDMNEFELASTQYKWVIQNAPGSQYSGPSALNVILATEKALPSDKELEKIRGQSLEPFMFSKEEQDFVTAAESYTQKFPKAEKVLDIRFKVGRLYYAHNYFDQALVIFKDIVNKNPKSEFAAYSANLILDIYNLRKDYEGLAKAGQELLSTPGLKSSDVNMDIQNVVEKAKFKEGQDLETKKDFVGSAKAYEQFSKTYPSSTLSPIAKFNAGINYERAGDLPKAVVLYSAFLASPGKENEKQRKETRRLVGRIYEKTGQLKKAAEEFEKFTADYPTDALTPDLYFNSAVIWTGFKNYSRAIKNYEMFQKTSKKANKMDTLFLIGEIYEKKGNLATANGYYEQYINAGPRDMRLVITAAYRIAKNAEKANNIKKSEEWFKKVIGLHKRAGGDIGARESAEAQFKFVQPTLQELIATRIPNNPQQQGPAIQRKLALVNRLNQELAPIVKLDVGEYVVASLATAGQAYENISDSIYKVPIPKGFNAEQQQQYMAEVDKVAGPLKQQAIDNYTNAINKARQIDIYSDYVKTSYQALDRINKSEKVLEEMSVEYVIPKVNL